MENNTFINEKRGWNMSRKIGIFEDDEALGGQLSTYLKNNGYDVIWFEPSMYAGKNEAQVLELIKEQAPDMLLLDVGLPGLDGIHLCKEFRASSSVPVIMITSELTELMSIKNGADDFVPKPFNPQILLAHMETVLSRVYRTDKVSDVYEVSQTVEGEDGQDITQKFVFELTKGKVSCGNDTAELSKNEMNILKILVEHQGEIVSRNDIIDALWDNYMFVDDNTLNVNMTRLKGKLEGIGLKNSIVTKRGLGYQLI